VVQEVDSRFSQWHQGLILADRLSTAISIDTRDLIEISNITTNSLLCRNPLVLSLGRDSKVEKSTIKILPFKNGVQLQISCLQSSDISSSSQDPYHSSYYPRGKCKRSYSVLWNQSAMSEERLSDRGMLLIHCGTDYKPEPEVIYQMKQNWRKWTNLASF